MPTDPLVLCIGNLLRRDDGIAVRLAADPQFIRNVPVRVADAGNGGFGALALADGHDPIIVVDAAELSGEPGDVRIVRNEELRSPASASLHAPTAALLQRFRESLSPVPRIVYLGIQGARTDHGAELSPEIATYYPRIREQVTVAIIDEINRLAPDHDDRSHTSRTGGMAR
ncbi:MAG: hypothetical protein CME06_05410 [Gemmatimonadetes bacterium]|nr:hypothetical protein [Gemmatimonadota bacterium]